MTWIVEDEDGFVTQVEERPGSGRVPAGRRSAKLPRAFDHMVEAWDWDLRRIVPVPEGQALAVQLAHEEKHGVMSAHLARAIKHIEARMLLGLPSTLQLEAEALGVDPVEHAHAIIAQAEQGTRAELRRVVARHQARS